MKIVMAGLAPAIHVFAQKNKNAWMPGTSPGMTSSLVIEQQPYAVWRIASAPARSTLTSVETPRSAMVTPNRRSMRAMVIGW